MAKPKGTSLKPELPKIFIGLTTYRYIEQKTTQSVINAMGGLGYPCTYASHTSANVWKGRNTIVEYFLGSGADYLFFIDADMVFEPEHMRTMIQAAEDTPDAGIIGAFYVSRDELMRPLLGWMNDEGTDELPGTETIPRLLESRGKLVECSLIATGFMLIRRNVLEALPNPWFTTKTTVRPDGEVLNWSSDNVFVHSVREAGFKTYGHFGVEVGHIGNFIYHPQHIWSRLETWNVETQLAGIKEQLGNTYGYDTAEYWNSLYDVEESLNRFRVYPLLYKAIVAGIQDHWTVLDMGSGTGNLATQMAEVASQVVCKDFSEYAVKACNDKDLDAEVFDLVKDDVPVGEHGIYDCVVCTEVLEHLEEPEKAIKKLYSFLKPDGLLMVSVPDNRLPPEEEPEHVTTYTAAKLAVLLKPFEEVFVEPIADHLLGVGKKPTK